MKKFIFPFFLGILMTSGFAFKTISEIKKDYAQVYEFPKYKGLHVFTDCVPMTPYDTIGKIKLGIFSEKGEYTTTRNNILKKCNEVYPKADGIITNIDPYGRGMNFDAYVIQFKK